MNSHVARTNVRGYKKPCQIYSISRHREADPYMFKKGKGGGFPTYSVCVFREKTIFIYFVWSQFIAYTSLIQKTVGSAKQFGKQAPPFRKKWLPQFSGSQMHAAGYTQTLTPVEVHGVTATNTVNVHFQLRWKHQTSYSALNFTAHSRNRPTFTINIQHKTLYGRKWFAEYQFSFTWSRSV